MNLFGAALSTDFWITGIAIARYIPRAFRTKQFDGNLFFTEEKRQEYRRRVESVTLNSRRKCCRAACEFSFASASRQNHGRTVCMGRISVTRSATENHTAHQSGLVQPMANEVQP
jgi:hypothetical protein